jgi:SAM-dependent methyltransferase
MKRTSPSFALRARFANGPRPAHIAGVTHVLFDRAILARRRARAARGERPGFLLERAVAELAERLSLVKREFAVAADIGALGPGAIEAMRASGKVRRTVACAPPGAPGGDLVGEEERLPFGAQTLDLAVSLLGLQLVNDLPGALVQIRRALKPDGLFLAAVLGGASLRELRDSFAAAEAELEGGVSPRVAPFADVRDLGGLLQRAGFALPVADLDTVTVRYADPFSLMRDLRAMGAANPLVERSRKPLRRATLLRAAALYAERYGAADGRVPATFDIVWLAGWAPHESQQKPLRPGSAKMRLADALGSVEVSAGEKARR